MKKAVSLFLVLLLIVCALPLSAYADSKTQEAEVLHSEVLFYYPEGYGFEPGDMIPDASVLEVVCSEGLHFNGEFYVDGEEYTGGTRISALRSYRIVFYIDMDEDVSLFDEKGSMYLKIRGNDEVLPGNLIVGHGPNCFSIIIELESASLFSFEGIQEIMASITKRLSDFIDSILSFFRGLAAA